MRFKKFAKLLKEYKKTEDFLEKLPYRENHDLKMLDDAIKRAEDFGNVIFSKEMFIQDKYYGTIVIDIINDIASRNEQEISDAAINTKNIYR